MNPPSVFPARCLSTVFLACLSFLSRQQAVRALSFSRSNVGDNNFEGEILKLVDRTYVPYGPDLTSNPAQTADSQPWTGLGYGTGATEHWAYDYKERYVYSQSEIGGYITVLDFATLPAAVTKFSLDVGGRDVEIKDAVVCPEEGLLFVTLTDRSTVHMYETVKRSSPKIPTVLAEFAAGKSPDAMKLSKDCSILAVANQNEGTSILTEGSLTLVKDFRNPNGPQTLPVRLNGFTDEYLLGRDVHMPLTKNAMTYWSRELGLGWEESGNLLDQYNPALAMDPEFLAFNDDGSELYLNLQDNSALVRIDTATGDALSVDGYGLKPATSGTGFDIVKDGECQFVTNSCLYLGRTPDGIFALEYEGVPYVLTADEGSDFDLGDYEEKFDSNDLFMKNGTFAFEGWSFADDFFVAGDSSKGCSANFNAECEDLGLPWCSNFELTVGSSAVDYSNPQAPRMERIVGFGGRGISIFEIPGSTNDRISQVWDSADEFEKEVCDKFPWANNALQDEEFAPVQGPRWILSEEGDREDIEARNDPLQDGCTLSDGTTGACPMSETVDEKAESDGLAVESVVAGVACDRLVMVGCGENNGVCLLYDITDGPESPVLLKTFSTSPASENSNPEQAYKAGTLGDLDTETMLMVTPEQSPTGRAGLMMGGAISGTLSFYEFECRRDEQVAGDGFPLSSSGSGSGEDEDDGLSSGAIAGIVLVGVAVIGALALVSRQNRGKNAKEVDPATAEVDPATAGVEMTSTSIVS